MNTSANNIETQVRAKDVRFEGNILHIALSGGSEISLPVHQMLWLRWLANASPGQRAKWTIEPGGFAVYWEELDDGFEIEHLLRKLRKSPLKGSQEKWVSVAKKRD